MIDAKLETLIALMEEKNYTKTAQKVYITQPSVTYHIQSIEKDYGITLFENAKSFELTEEGNFVLTVQVDEGKRYRVKDIDIQVNLPEYHEKKNLKKLP